MKREKIQWHPGFCAAIQIELEKEAANIEFHAEYNLSKKPLQTDLVIIKKTNHKPLEKESSIYKILSMYNILEYKSPSDTLTIDDYYKVNAYAGLFKTESTHVDEIKARDITIIFVCSKRPLKLLKYLKDYCKMVVSNVSPGIYEAVGTGLFRTYFVIAHPKYGGDYPWLNALTDSFGKQDQEHVKYLMQEMDENYDSNREAVLDVVMKANRELTKSIMEEDHMRSSLEILFAAELDEIKEQMKAKAEADVMAEIQQVKSKAEADVMAEIQQARSKAQADVIAEIQQVKSKAEADVMAEIQQVKSKAQADIMAEIQQVKSKAQADIMAEIQQIRSDALAQVIDEINTTIRPQIEAQIKSDAEARIKAEAEKQIRSEVETQIRSQIESETILNRIRQTVRNLFQRGFSPEEASGIAELDLKIIEKWHMDWMEGLPTHGD